MNSSFEGLINAIKMTYRSTLKQKGKFISEVNIVALNYVVNE